MVLNFRTLLFVVLVLLQSIAPLVHAHAHDISRSVSVSPSSKLHVPGLENYAFSNDANPSCYRAAPVFFDEGQVVGINSGIRQNNTPVFFSSDSNSLSSSSQIVKPSFLPCHVSWVSTPLTLLVNHLSLTGHTPRAPPSHSFRLT